MSNDICPLCGNRFARRHSRQVYCHSHACQQRANEIRRGRDPAKYHPVETTRQAPLTIGCPAVYDRRVVIHPPMPAPMKRYETGDPCLFQDDLRAIADHGSPGTLPRELAHSSYGSPLAAIYQP